MAKSNLALKDDDVSELSSLTDFMMDDAGKGVSQSQEDNIVPLIYLLQSNSAPLKRSSDNYIAGSEAGDVWKRNSIHKSLVKSDEGFLFQPCFFEKVWPEWRPNRGGLVGIHKDKPPDARETVLMQEGKERKAWIRANGNSVVETRQHVGFADGEAYVIPLSSTGHSVSRQFMQMMNQVIIPGTNKIAPSFSCKYKFTTVERTKDSNSWFVFKVEPGGWVSPEEYRRGKALYEAFSKGEKTADVVDHDLDQGRENEEEVPF